MHKSLLLCVLVGTGCVTSGTHQKVVDELAKTRSEYERDKEDWAKARAELIATRDGLSDDKLKLIALRDALSDELRLASGRGDDLDGKLTAALGQNQALITKVSAMGQNVEKLLGEKDKMAEERERLAMERKELASEVVELKKLRAAAEARNAEYKKVLEKLKKMIDAGTLSVKFRGGRMLVQMSSDVVFKPGDTNIKSEAKAAIVELADTIKQFPDRKFQVIGHSDSQPIKTERFPSNWELSSQRAIEVVRLMVESGVPPEMLSAAGYAEFDPLARNDTPKNKAQNRRVEIVFQPKLDELPGFDTVLSK